MEFFALLLFREDMRTAFAGSLRLRREGLEQVGPAHELILRSLQASPIADGQPSHRELVLRPLRPIASTLHRAHNQAPLDQIIDEGCDRRRTLEPPFREPVPGGVQMAVV